MNLLSISNLRTTFHTRHGIVRAVSGVSFDVAPNEIVGIVGESGCGKTVLCQSIMGLIQIPPGRIEYDEIAFDGTAINPANEKAMRAIRGNVMSTVFQDPMTSLNPYMRISDQLIEPLLIHGVMNKKEALLKAVKALADVGIDNAEKRIHQYPHEFSGGMRQRVSIAMALIAGPKLLFADEPTTALDVTVQAQILSLIKEIQKKTGIAVVFITHDFGVVAGLCNRVMVMYAGKIVESATTEKIFNRPMHPYTKALLQSLPARSRGRKKLYTIPRQPPDLAKEIVGCSFAPRCPHCTEKCAIAEIGLEEVAEGHFTACLRIQKSELSDESL